MFCGKCGANIPDGYDFCMKCGTKINAPNVDTNEASISDIAPTKKSINKKVFIPVISAIAIFLVIVAIVSGTRGVSEKNGYFANIPWGTDIKTVQKKVDAAYNCESLVDDKKNTVDAVIENYDGINGLSAWLSLRCHDEKTLDSVCVFFHSDNKSNYTEIVDKLIEKYDKLFGESEGDDFSHKWSTKNSTIKLNMLSKEGASAYLVFEKK